jgi:hypothetical protein
MITGAHAILYSTDPNADRAFLRDVLAFPSVDVGGGWLIFGLPPAEVAIHPSDTGGVHELSLICDDVAAFVADMKKHHVKTGPIQTQPWGQLTHITLPGGGKLGVYEARHPRPEPVEAPGVKKTTARRAAPKKAAKRPPAKAKPAAKKKRGAR